MCTHSAGIYRADTVFFAQRKAIAIKINYLYVLTSPLGRKFHADSKHDLKKFHTILEGPKFFVGLPREMTLQILGTLPYGESMGKYGEVWESMGKAGLNLTR